MKILYVCAVLLLADAVFGLAGEYIPRSYYVIDNDGHQSDIVYFRSKRDIEQFPLFRVRRSSSSASAHASASASASSSSGGFYGNSDFVPPPDNVNFPNLFNRFSELANQAASGSGGGGSGGHSFSSSSSYGNGQGSGTGYSSTGGTGGYNGPILFSRFGEEAGSGVQASGSAQGPHGAFSSTSTSSKDGKVTYSVQSGKY